MIGQKIAGRYTLEKNLGSGEIGVVYSAIHDDGKRRVAIKVLHPDVAETFGEELLRWGKRAAQIRHVRIANILGANRMDDGTTYFITEFVQGDTLMGQLKSQGPFSSIDVADILFQLCSALAPIHRAGRPHANLKPENVFLSPGDDGKPFVKIVDVGSPVIFGAHHLAGERQVVGSPKYFSPEQATGESVGLASDQFALGVTGYLLLTGALPFFGATPDQLLTAIIEAEPKPILERTPSVHAGLADIVMTCLAKKPDERFDGLRALAVALADFIKDARSRPAESVDMPSSDGDRTQAVDLQTLLQRAAEEAGEDSENTVLFKADDPSVVESVQDSDEPPVVPEFLIDDSIDVSGSERPSNVEPAIPQPLASTGELGQAELQAAMAASMKDLGQMDVESGTMDEANPDDSGGFDLAAAMAAAVEDVQDDSMGGSALSQMMDELEVDEPAPVAGRTSGSLLPEDLLAGLESGNPETAGAEPVHMNDAQSAPVASLGDFGEVEHISDREKKKRLARMTNALPRTGGLRRPYFVLFLLALLAASVFVATTIMEDEERMEEDAALKDSEKFKEKEQKAKANRLSVRLETEPPGAKIFENDRKVMLKKKTRKRRQAVTPHVFHFDKGRTKAFTLKFELEGYETGTYSVVPKELNYDANSKLKPIKVILTLESQEASGEVGVNDDASIQTDGEKPSDAASKESAVDSATPQTQKRTNQRRAPKRSRAAAPIRTPRASKPKARKTLKAKPKARKKLKPKSKPKQTSPTDDDTDDPY